MIMHSCALMPEAERQTFVEEVRAMVVACSTWDVVSAHTYPSSGCVSMPCSASRDSLPLHLRVLRLVVCPTTVWSTTGRAVGARRWAWHWPAGTDMRDLVHVDIDRPARITGTVVGPRVCVTHVGRVHLPRIDWSCCLPPPLFPFFFRSLFFSS